MPASVQHLVNTMSEAYQFLALVLFVWFACLIQSHRLFYKFRAKYPEIAQREIPRAFETYEHPEKLIYFLRPKSREVLRNDPELWWLRQQVKFLTILSVIMPPAGIVYLLRTVIS
ncbi:MAG TPA: hypothetical protein VL171_08620 [Verrucomicrobiae bacterium]|nr:hypothetical protein [Verrucomicrobiae bacterium]